jgi:pimeloyl-ACP methyl ester carboxylesterase
MKTTTPTTTNPFIILIRTICSFIGGLFTFILIFTGIPIIYTSLRFSIESCCNPLPPNAIYPHKHVKTTSTHNKKNETIIFIHGWPDDIGVFANVAEIASSQEQGYDCVLLTLPGYPLPGNNDSTINKGTMPNRHEYGFSFEELCLGFKNTVLEIASTLPSSSIILVAHDWGAFITYLSLAKYETELQPHINRLIALDVGLPKHPSCSFEMFLNSYQGLLNIVYMMPKYFGGNGMTRTLTKAFGQPTRANAVPVSSAMNYPYRHFWVVRINKAKIWAGRKTPSNIKFLFCHGSVGLPGYLHFYDETFLNEVKASSPQSKVEGFEGGHWFFIVNAEKFHKTMFEWLENTSTAAVKSNV